MAKSTEFFIPVRALVIADDSRGFVHWFSSEGIRPVIRDIPEFARLEETD